MERHNNDSACAIISGGFPLLEFSPLDLGGEFFENRQGDRGLLRSQTNLRQLDPPPETPRPDGSCAASRFRISMASRTWPERAASRASW